MAVSICLAAFFLYAQALEVHGVTFRDDEVFYFRSTQEMLARGDYFSPTYFGIDRFQKPILFYWMVLAAYRLFGITWYAARVPAVLFASLTVGLTWAMARDLFGRRVADLSAMILMTVPLFFRHAKAAVPDMPLDFFVVLAIWGAMRFFQKRERWGYLVLFYAACALGFMTKGYTAWIVPFMVVVLYALCSGEKDVIKEMRFPWGILFMAAVVLPWFVYMIMTHGDQYTRHVLLTETHDRIISNEARNAAMKVLLSLGRNSLFYIKVLLNYFAPWSLFFGLALPLGSRGLRRGDARRPALLWLFLWLGVVFFFFSLIHVTISHYLLVLTAPFAILVSYFFVELAPRSAVLSSLTRIFFSVVMGCMFLGLTFVTVFMAQGSPVWVLVYALGMIGGILVQSRHRDVSLAPFLTGLLMVFVLAQGRMLARAGLTSFPTLQRLAETVKRDWVPGGVITVGSHDLHENEWQIFLDQQVEKAGHSHQPREYLQLKQALASERQVFCLITEKDFRTYEKDFEEYHCRRIDEGTLLRKRFRFDRGFLLALLRLDRGRVQDYLKEKVLLLKKEALPKDAAALPS